MTGSPYWFRARRYGWGWGLPLTWQGWCVIGGYLAVVLVPLFFGTAGAIATLVAAAVATPILLWICYRKGEPPKWRWGAKS